MFVFLFKVVQFVVILGIAFAEPWGRGGWGGRGGGGWGWGRKRRSAEEIVPIESENLSDEQNHVTGLAKRSAEPWGRGGWGGRGEWGGIV